MPLPSLPNPRGVTARLKGLMLAFLACAFLGPTLLLCNLAQTLSLLVLPFSRRTFRRFNRAVADIWWGWCVSVSRRLHGIRIELSGDAVPDEENALVLINHQQMSDITFLMLFARLKRRLGDMKWFVKDAVKYVPGVGWGMLFLDCLFVKRSWARDKASIRATFSRILEDRVPIWLLSFPEGTRLTPAKLRKSQAFARERGFEPLQHLLLPRARGFVASVEGLRDHIVAVYDVTLGYEGGAPTLWQYIQGFAKVAHVHVRRYAMDQLPRSAEELERWLRDRFEEKDRILEAFYAEGSFSTGAAPE